MANLFKMEVGRWNAFMGKLAEAGLTAEMCELALRDPTYSQEVVDSFVEVTTYAVTVDPSANLAELVDAGKYGSVWPRMTEQFPPSVVGRAEAAQGPSEVAFCEVDPRRDVSNSEIKRLLDKRNMRPATFLELLAFGVKYPDYIQHLIALGSPVRSGSGTLFPARTERVGAYGVRVTMLHFTEPNDVEVWSSGCRFAAVRK